MGLGMVLGLAQEFVMWLQSEIEVEPGDCRQLIVTSLAKTREGKAAYRVPIHGKVSVWTKNRIRLPEIGDDGRPHWNWLIPLTVLVETAAVSFA